MGAATMTAFGKILVNLPSTMSFCYRETSLGGDEEIMKESTISMFI